MTRLKQVNYEDMRLFILSYDKGEFPKQRFGQAFCNHFMITDPNVFYEKYRKIAMDFIYQTYITVCDKTG
jgi:hypothetical protein